MHFTVPPFTVKLVHPSKKAIPTPITTLEKLQQKQQQQPPPPHQNVRHQQNQRLNTKVTHKPALLSSRGPSLRDLGQLDKMSNPPSQVKEAATKACTTPKVVNTTGKSSSAFDMKDLSSSINHRKCMNHPSSGDCGSSRACLFIGDDSEDDDTDYFSDSDDDYISDDDEMSLSPCSSPQHPSVQLYNNATTYSLSSSKNRQLKQHQQLSRNNPTLPSLSALH